MFTPFETAILQQDGIDAQALQTSTDEELWVHAIVTNKWLLRKCPIRNEDIYLQAVTDSGTSLEYIPDDQKTEEMCYLAVSNWGYALTFVPERFRTHDVCMRAVQSDGDRIKHIENPSEDVCFAAIESKASAIQYIRNPTEDMIYYAIDKNPRVINYIENPTEEMCLRAIHQLPASIVGIKKPNNEMIELAISKDPNLIQNLSRRCTVSEELEWLAIKHDPALLYCTRQTREMIEYVMSIDVKLIQHARDPPLDLCEYAIDQDVMNLVHLPSDPKLYEYAMSRCPEELRSDLQIHYQNGPCCFMTNGM